PVSMSLATKAAFTAMGTSVPATKNEYSITSDPALARFQAALPPSAPKPFGRPAGVDSPPLMTVATMSTGTPSISATSAYRAQEPGPPAPSPSTGAEKSNR